MKPTSKSSPNKHETREAWLKAAVDIGLRPWFEKNGHRLPHNIRYAQSFTSGGRKGKDRYETLYPEASADGSFEIIISSQQDDPIEVLEGLTHSGCHVVAGREHNGRFGDTALSVGLVKVNGLRETAAGPVLRERLNDLAETLGPLPHAKVDFDRIKVKKSASADRPPKQEGRMRKAVCEAVMGDRQCGYTVRVARSHAKSPGPPHCPLHGAMRVLFKPEDHVGDIIDGKAEEVSDAPALTQEAAE
ncbi:hypothetical protein [Roseicella sp. DB1501]|uniref:hypothetical protein n=1 Tax=Roseicella sp. DB1501 TaxID=2730925 RepID=UPI001490DF47|nr:hypothetical protein [Roseicella sp. DB1501]NOG70471.1 hypothetical protein [Roseicella sp. DB1501]